MTLHHLIVCEITTRNIYDILLFCTDAAEDSNSIIGGAVIVSPHHRLVVGIRSDNGNLLCITFQRQDIVIVLQEHQ